MYGRRELPAGWTRGEKPQAQEVFEFSILLKERNLVQLEAHATAVSDPKSPRYGQHWSAARIKELVAPVGPSVTEVTDWLRAHGAAFKLDGAALSVRASVAVTECLLGTKMGAYQHDSTGTRRVRHLGAVSMPASVAEKIHLVWGVNELFKPVEKPTVSPELDHGTQPQAATETRRSSDGQRRSGTTDGGVGAPLRHAINTDLMTPAKLRSMYGSTGASMTTDKGKKQSQAFVNFNYQVITPGAMGLWNAKYGGSAHIDKTYYNGTVYDGSSPPGGYGPEGWYGLMFGEPDLDNYEISVMGSGATTWNWDSGFDKSEGHMWMLNFANEVLAMPDYTRPHVFSISYGGSELFQCDMLQGYKSKQSLCMQGAGTANTMQSRPYVAATEAGFQKLALAGITVIVASGDDGAPNLAGGGQGIPGNYPLDPARNCASKFHWWRDANSPAQGPYEHNYTKGDPSLNNRDKYCPGYPPEDKKPSKCSSFVLQMGCGYHCEFPMPTNTMFPFTTNRLQLSKKKCPTCHLVDYRGFTDKMLQILNASNPTCNLQWSYYSTIGDMALQVYSECECSAMTTGYMDKPTSSFNSTSMWAQSNNICQLQMCQGIPGYPNNPQNKRHSIRPYQDNRPTALDTYGGYGENSVKTDLMPVYPAASKWVTSVGGSALAADGQTHIVSSIWQGTWTTPGGGFSEYLTRPSWQTAAVQRWLSKNTSSAEVNVPGTRLKSKADNNRGYPDVAFQSFGFPTFQGLTNCSSASLCDVASVNKIPLQTAGTSASAPLFAGMVTLVNDHLTSIGKSRVGFLSPLLYTMATERPSVFKDITIGDNKCNKLYCSKWGYSAVAGWDPASGLGGVDYRAFKGYVAGFIQVFHGTATVAGYSISTFTGAVQEQYVKAILACLPAEFQTGGTHCCAEAFITHVDHTHRRTHHTLMPVTVQYTVEFMTNETAVITQAQNKLNVAMADASSAGVNSKFLANVIAAGLAPTASPTDDASNSTLVIVMVVVVIVVLAGGAFGVYQYAGQQAAERPITVHDDGQDDFHTSPPEYYEPSNPTMLPTNEDSTEKVIQL